MATYNPALIVVPKLVVNTPALTALDLVYNTNDSAISIIKIRYLVVLTTFFIMTLRQ